MQSVLKAKTDKPLAVSFNPYLHSFQSTSKIRWKILSMALPILFGSLVLFGMHALRIYSIAIISGLLFEYVFELITGQKSRIRDGSSLFISILFSFLMPEYVSLTSIVIGIFVATILAKELFGGVGQNLFHSVLAGYAAVLALFPTEFLITNQTELDWRFFIWNQPPILGTGSPLLILMCGSFLIFKRLIRWENVLFYFGFAFLGFYLMRFEAQSLGWLLLIAFFFIIDSASGPITKAGRILFSTIAGLLTAAFCSWMNLYQASASAVLISNAIVPLIDHLCVHEQ